MSDQPNPQDHASAPLEAGGPRLLLESRPKQLYAATYDPLPFPHVGTQQEVAFDLGVTALGGDLQLTGLVFRGYREHQLLFEQRWPHPVVLRHSGEANLDIAAGTGLALRSLHFTLHAHDRLGFIEVLAIARTQGEGGMSGENVQARIQIPVVHHEQQTEVHFPLHGAWWAVQAGDWTDLHKQESFSQPFALDFVKLRPDNRFFGGDGRTLEDHASWNQPVYAAAGGKVAFVQFDMPDMAPGIAPDPRIFRDDPRRLLGNAVAISHANGEFTYYAHLQQASLAVNQGEMIRRGALLGRVGNSGQSPGPHLHLHLMEGPNLFIDQGLPLKLSHFWAGGEYYTRPTYVPVRMIVHGPDEFAD